MKYCRNCGKEVNDNQDVCLNCGTFLNNYNNIKLRKCKKCGEEFPYNVNKCPKCGKRYTFPVFLIVILIILFMAMITLIPIIIFVKNVDYTTIKNDISDYSEIAKDRYNNIKNNNDTYTKTIKELNSDFNNDFITSSIKYASSTIITTANLEKINYNERSIIINDLNDNTLNITCYFATKKDFEDLKLFSINDTITISGKLSIDNNEFYLESCKLK